MTGGATCYSTHLFWAIISSEYQIFSKVVGLNLSNLELPYGFQSVGYQIASCGECRFKPTTTRAYLWSIKHLDIKTSFWRHAWGQKSAFLAYITWDFSAHMAWVPHSHSTSKHAVLLERESLVLESLTKEEAKKWELNWGNQWEKYLLEERDCGDRDKVIKKLFELLKVKLRKTVAFRWAQPRRSFHKDSENQTLGECYTGEVEKVVIRVFELWHRIPRQKVLEQ